MTNKLSPELSQRLQHVGVPQIKRHIFLCCDQTKPNCCLKEVGLQSWDYLKNRLEEFSQNKSLFRLNKI